MKIQRGFKFRLKPLSKQATQQCWQQAGACRFVWNVFFKRQEYRRTRLKNTTLGSKTLTQQYYSKP
jgi:hypothetical protein